MARDLKPQTTPESPDDIVGHKTHFTQERGYYHTPLIRAECDAMFAACKAAEEKRATDMPDEKTAIKIMFDAWQRLKELGWSEAIYCPKDGSSFNVIEAGSTGVHRCHYMGEWPKGSWWIEEEGDSWPSHPILYRLDPEKEAEAKMKETQTTEIKWNDMSLWTLAMGHP